MNFQSRTEEEIDAIAIWPSGLYDFLVIEACEKKSRRGNDMIEVDLEITRKDGKKKIIRDYLLPQRPEKLMHAAMVCGVPEKYEQGLLGGDDFAGKRGRLKLGIQRETPEFPRRNVVTDYVVERESLASRLKNGVGAART